MPCSSGQHRLQLACAVPSACRGSLCGVLCAGKTFADCTRRTWPPCREPADGEALVTLRSRCRNSKLLYSFRLAGTGIGVYMSCARIQQPVSANVCARQRVMTRLMPHARLAMWMFN